MSISCTISNVAVANVESIRRPDRIDEHTQLTLTLRDASGTAFYQRGNPISLSDSILGNLFDGFVFQAHVQNLVPNPDNRWTLTCIAKGDYLAAQCTSERIYSNQYGGTILVDQVQRYGSREGLIARAALRWDEEQTTWAQGTRTNTVAVTNVTSGNPGDGDLELAQAGTQVTVIGTSATPTQTNGLKFTAYCSSGYTKPFVQRQIWLGPQTISSGDALVYDMWVSSDSPQIQAGIEIVCDDSTILGTTVGAVDQQGLSSYPFTDLSGLANDQWYTRTIPFPASMNGKNIVNLLLQIAGANSGAYTVYFRNIAYYSGGVLNYYIFGPNDILTTNNYASIFGYSNVSLTQVIVQDKTSIITHSSLSIDAAKMVRDSLMTYSSTIPTGATGICETSIDNGASWQQHTSGNPIPNLLGSMSIASRNVQYRHTLTLGKDPTASISFGAPTLTVDSAYNTTKSDSINIYTTSTDFNSGTLTDLITVGSNGISTNGVQRSWDSANLSSQTLYGSISPAQAIFNKQIKLTTGNTTDVRSRLDFAGQWQDFIAEVDVTVAPTNGSAGMVYRTVGWQNLNDTYGYQCEVYPNSLRLGYGTNTSGGGGAYTQLQLVTLSLTANSVHRLKVVVSGNFHQIYLDGVRYIHLTDSTYTAAGYIGLRLYNNTGATISTVFNHFGVCSALSGTWQSASIDISGPGTYGNSVVAWDIDGLPDTTTSITAQTSIDGGSTWQAATNGGAISGLAAGSSLSGKHLLVKMTLAASNAPVVPTLNGVTAWIMGQYSASGTRVSPSLSLASVGRAGTALVNWNALVPAHTSLVVKTSIDSGASWQTVSSAGGAISGITVQPAPIEDNFNSSGVRYKPRLFGGPVPFGSGYSIGNWGGANGTWFRDTANSRLLGTGGNYGTYVNSTALTAADNYVIADFDECDGSGILTNYTATTSGYYILIYDSAATGGTPNTMQLFRRSGGTSAQVGLTATISFTRGMIRRFKLDVQAGVLTASMDGATLISYIDGSPLGAGKSGFVLNALLRAYSLRIQQYGQDVSSLSFQTQLILSTTDPTVTPQVLDLQAMVSSPDIGAGSLIPSKKYQGTFLLDNFKDITTISNYWYYFSGLNIIFQPRNAKPAPFVLATVNRSSIAGQMIGDILLDGNGMDVIGDSYRNRMKMKNAIATNSYVETRFGDGQTRTWNVSHPLSAPPTSIILNGKVQTFGIKNVDSGKNFYYQLNSTAIDQDVSGTLMQKTDSFVISYTGTSSQDVTRDNTGFVGTISQAQMAAIQNAAGLHTSGIIEAVVDASNMTVAEAQAAGDQYLLRYGKIGRSPAIKTLRSGLTPGMQIPVFIPQYSTNNVQLLITQVDIVPNISTSVTGGILYMYKITVLEGANLQTWVRLFQSLAS